MRKVSWLIYLLALGAMVLSLSGCSGSSSNSFVENEDVVAVAEVAVIESPVFEQGHSYRIIEGATLSGMDGAKYFVANKGSSSGASVLNLGFVDELGDQTLVFVDDSTGNVVFAYDPSGSDSRNKTSGSVGYSGGTRMKYTSLTIPGASMFSAMNVETSGAKVIVLNGDSATIDGSAVPTYDYVWHCDPDHADVYYTLGLSGTDELDEDTVTSAIGDQTVYIARDVHYMTDSLDFTGTAKNDEETEYAAYYSATVSADVASSKYPSSPDLWGPYIFATLPQTMGAMGGMGRMPGDMSGTTPPDMSGTAPDMGTTPPDISGTAPDMGGTPPSFSASASYNSQIASTIELMTHSAEEAYENPVLHICKAGVYQLQGTWNGQIWIDVGTDSDDKVAIILNGVDVTCSVAPAIVFHDLYECGPDDEDEVASRIAASSSDIGYSVLDDAGAMVIIADDTVNNFTGANVYRMLKPQVKKASVTTIDGTDVDQQKKRWKMDGAFYSFVSMAMGGGSKQNGVLNVKSTTYEGLNTERHMTLESGVVTVYAPDDAMNFNEDNVSVFTMISGDLTVTATGGDGIDSNGWIVILGGSLDVTAAQDSDQLNAGAEGPLDADCGVYMADGVNYSHRASSGTTGGVPGTPGEMSGDVPGGAPGEMSGDVPGGAPGGMSGDVPPTAPGGSSGDVAPGIPASPVTTNTTALTTLSTNATLVTALLSALGLPAGTSLLDNSTLIVGTQTPIATAQTALRALTSIFSNAASAVVAFTLPAISSPASGIAVIGLPEANIASYRGKKMSAVFVPKTSASSSAFRASAAADVQTAKFLKADGTLITGNIPTTGDISVASYMEANVEYDPMIVEGELTAATGGGSTSTGGGSTSTGGGSSGGTSDPYTDTTPTTPTTTTTTPTTTTPTTTTPTTTTPTTTEPTTTPTTQPVVEPTPETPTTTPTAPTTETPTTTTEPEATTPPTTETPTTTTEPEPEDEPTISPAPTTQDYTSDTISGTSGITTFTLGLTGSSMTIRSDPDAATPRGISSSSNVFQITRSVNTFSGITPDN